MKILWTLIHKDLLRDAKHPWGILILTVIPVLTAWLMALVFSPQNNRQKQVTIHVAFLDRDDDFLSGVFRSMSNQGDVAKGLKLHLVETIEDGLALVERRKVSAFVVFPERLTLDLLDGKATAITIFKNPAQAILPKIVEQGLDLAALAVSQVLNLAQPELKNIREMVDRDRMPEALEVAAVAADTVTRLKTVEPYLFPLLIQYQTVSASNYVAHLSSDLRQEKAGGP